MSEDTSENEDLSSEVLIHLAESRSQLHASFASNALTLLGIQIAVLPVSFAVASFVASPEVPSVPEGQRLEWAMIQVLVAIVFFATSVVLSFDVYRRAKRQQYVWLDALRDHLNGARQEFAELSHARSERIDNRITDAIGRVTSDYDLPPARKELRRELGTAWSDEHRFRMGLLTSIACTLLAAFLSTTGILTVIGRELLAIGIMVVFLAVWLAYMLQLYVDILAVFTHSPVRSISGILAFLWTAASPGLRMIRRSLPRYIGNRLSDVYYWLKKAILRS